MTREDLWVSGRTGFTADGTLHQKNLRQIEDYINNVILEEELGEGSIEDFQILSMSISKLIAGELDADMLIDDGAIRTGNSGTRRIEFDSLGIRLIDDDETVLFELSTVGDSTTSSDIDGTVQVNDSIILANAVNTPALGPSASTINDYISFAVGAGERQSAYYDTGLGYYFFLDAIYNGAGSKVWRRVDTSGVNVTSVTLSSSGNAMGIVYNATQNKWYEPIFYANELWWLIYSNSLDDRPILSGYTAWRETPIVSVSSGLFYRGSVTTDGTSIYFAYARSSDNKPVFRTYTPGATTLTNTASVVGDTAVTGASGYYVIDGYFRGSADFGSTRHIIGDIGDPNFRIFNNSGVRQTAEEWPRATAAGNWSAPSGGLVYIGGQFKEVTSSVLSRLVTHNPSDIPAGTYQLAYTFYDSDATGGTHETALSPRTEIEVFERQAISVSWQAPPDGGGTDDPDSIRIYMVAAGADPGAAFASYFRQGTTYAGTSTTLTEYDTGTAGAQDTAFSGSGAPGEFVTSVAGFEVRGDGTVILPTFNGPPSGPTQGQIYYDTSDDITYVWDGAAWQALYP